MPLAACGPLVDNLCRLQLLDEQQQRELVDSLRLRFDDPRQLARELLRRDWLTAHQANYLLQGRGDQLLFGSFSLLERLGQGGMGQVFKARHRALGRLVALKIIRKEALGHPTAVPRFEREVEAAARLQHLHVVRAFDAGQADGTYYLAMELLEGADLFHLVKQSGPLPVTQACDYLRQAALGLQHAHEHDLIHRDIKPANLFVTRKVGSREWGENRWTVDGGRWTENTNPPTFTVHRPPSTVHHADRPPISTPHFPWGVVKILDFGLARLHAPVIGTGRTALTQLGSVLGTPDFIAPEQAWDSHTIDIRADLYSLGCTFYFLLAGQVPFPGGSLPEKLIKHRNAEAEPVDQARRDHLLGSGLDAPSAGHALDLPSPVIAMTRRLMAKQPDQRFQTPAELAEAMGALISQLAEDRPTAVIPRPSRKTSPAQRRPDLERQRQPSTEIFLPAETAQADPIVVLPTLPGRPGRLRKGLVLLGFCLCCGLCARLWANDATGAEGRDRAPIVKPKKSGE